MSDAVPYAYVRATIVVPCYNERLRLDAPAFVRALDASPRLSFVFVDDGSADDTRSLLEEIRAARPDRSDVLVLPENRGKAEAVRAGLQRAISREAPYVGYWDADLATPLNAVDDFVAVLDERPACWAVIGSRVRLLGRHIDRRPMRHYLGRVFATAASAVLGLPVYDTQCGAKLFRASPHLAAALAQPFPSRWAFDVELIARLCSMTDVPAEHIVEQPLLVWRDVGGSKLSAWSSVRSGLDLARIAWRYRVRTPLDRPQAGAGGREVSPAAVRPRGPTTPL